MEGLIVGSGDDIGKNAEICGAARDVDAASKSDRFSGVAHFEGEELVATGVDAVGDRAQQAQALVARHRSPGGRDGAAGGGDGGVDLGGAGFIDAGDLCASMRAVQGERAAIADQRRAIDEGADMRVPVDADAGA